MSKTGIVHDAAIEALDVIRDVVGGMRTEQLGDRAILAQYAQHRGNPQAILAFTASRGVPPDKVEAEAVRYVGEMESLLAKQTGGRR